jgi:hypothetical protein
VASAANGGGTYRLWNLIRFALAAERPGKLVFRMAVAETDDPWAVFLTVLHRLLVSRCDRSMSFKLISSPITS